MRKQLLAFFSALGLAGAAISGTAQVLKGKNSSATTAQTQQNQNLSDKAVLIGLLSQSSDAKQKARKAGPVQGLGDARNKQFKGMSESVAGGELTRDKRHKLELENDAARKQQTIKLTNAQMGDGSVRNASNAVESVAAKKKADQASPKF